LLEVHSDRFSAYYYSLADFCSMLRQVIFIEMVVQPMQGLIDPPKPDSSAQLRTADLVVIDRDVQALIVDLEILTDLVKVNCVSF